MVRQQGRLRQRMKYFTLHLMMLAGLYNVVPAAGQEIKSRYQLKHVRVVLLSGEVISGKLMDITPDSVVMHDPTIAPVGSRVDIRVRYSDNSIQGVVRAFTPDKLTVGIGEQKEYSIARKEITDLKIKDCPLDAAALKRFQRRTIPSSTIKHIAIHKRGAGLLGGFVGMTAGAALMYGLTAEDEPFKPRPGIFSDIEVFQNSTPTVMGGLVGMGVGAVIGTTNKKLEVNGDPARFTALANKIKKNR